MALKSVVFDFDGIIADSEPTHYQAYQLTLGRWGVQFDFDEYKRRYLGYDDRDVFKIALGDRLKSVDMTQLLTEKADHFEALVPQMKLQPGVVEWVQVLKSAQIPLAICSGAVRRDIDAVLNFAGGGRLRGYFETIVSADEVEASKPDPTCYRMAVARLANKMPGLQASECLAFEDTVAGLTAARGAGLFAVGVTHTCPAAQLSPRADRVIDGFLGLSMESLKAWLG